MNVVELLNRLTTGRALLLGLVIAAFYYFLIFDSGVNQKNQIESTRQQITQLQNDIEENQRKLDRALVYKKTAAEVGSTINKLLSLIPEKFSMPDLMRIVSNEVKVAGSSLVSITPNETKVSPAADEFEELSLSVDLNGSFLQHMIFLSNLTKVQQILIIRKFDFGIAREARGDDPPVVKMTAEIVAYRYRGQAKTKEPGP